MRYSTFKSNRKLQWKVFLLLLIAGIAITIWCIRENISYFSQEKWMVFWSTASEFFGLTVYVAYTRADAMTRRKIEKNIPVSLETRLFYAQTSVAGRIIPAGAMILGFLLFLVSQPTVSVRLWHLVLMGLVILCVEIDDRYRWSQFREHVFRDFRY